MNQNRSLLLATFFTALVFCLPLQASPPPEFSNSPITLAAKSDQLSMDQAAAKVREQTGGRILSARAENKKGRTTYRIKVLLPSGHVRIVRVDAATGAMD